MTPILFTLAFFAAMIYVAGHMAVVLLFLLLSRDPYLIAPAFGWTTLLLLCAFLITYVWRLHGSKNARRTA